MVADRRRNGACKKTRNPKIEIRNKFESAMQKARIVDWDFEFVSDFDFRISTLRVRMARHIDPVCRLCRREGVKLYLKGSRCESPKCAIERRNQPPGMHVRRGKLTEYGERLREKQKLKRFYGLLEKQFRRYFQLSSRSTENTGEALLRLLERRLDNVVHRLRFAPSRAGAPPPRPH